MRRLTLVCLLACSAALAADAPARYHLARSIVLGGDGGWDYLSFDPAGRRLFISRSTRVQVLDVDKGSVIAEIPDTQGVHGVALAPELGKGFTTDGRENAVTVFDLKSLKVTAKVQIPGDRPDAIAYESATQRLFTFNGGSDDSTVLDARNNAIVATVKLPGRPEAAVADGAGRVYVNIEDKSELSAIDARQAKVINTWPLAPCDSPSAIALDAAHKRVFSGCDNKLMAVSDAEAGKVVATAQIGEGVDAGIFDAGAQRVFMANGEGTLSVIQEEAPDRYTVLEQAPTRKYARTLALDPVSHTVYLVTADLKITPAPAGATGQAARPKREVLPGSFTVLVMQPGNAPPK